MKHGYEDDFLAKCRNIDFSADSKNKEKNLEMLKSKLINENEKGIIHMKKRFKRPIAVAACFIAVLAISTAAFGQDVVNYIRTTMLGEHVSFVVPVIDRNTVPIATLDGESFFNLDDEKRAYLEDSGILCPESDAEFVLVTAPNPNDLLTFADAQEGRSHFITDALLPTYTPEGFEFRHIFYFVESLEELQEYGANMFMGVVFSNSTDEISMQIRYMTEETGFMVTASEDMHTIEVSGHEAVVDGNMLTVLIGDVMYMFFGHSGMSSEELVKMAESLQ